MSAVAAGFNLGAGGGWGWAGRTMAESRSRTTKWKPGDFFWAGAPFGDWACPGGTAWIPGSRPGFYGGAYGLRGGVALGLGEAEAEEAGLAEEERAAAAGEEAGDRGVGEVEAAGIGAESWEHQAVAVGDEAGAGDPAGAGDDAGFGMVVAAEFGFCAMDGLVAEGEALVDPFVGRFAREAGGDGVVVAGDPYEIGGLGHGVQAGGVRGGHATRAVAVVEAVAEGDDGGGAVAAEQQGEPGRAWRRCPMGGRGCRGGRRPCLFPGAGRRQ